MSALARPLPDGQDSLVLQMFWEHPLAFLIFVCNSDWYTYKVAVGDSSFTLKCLSIGTPRIIHFPFVSMEN